MASRLSGKVNPNVARFSAYGVQNSLLPAVLNIPNHFTASAVVIWADHILLVHHKRLSAWVPPGGHIEPGELPHQAAMRETFEETGVAVQVLSEEMPVTGHSQAFFLPQPICTHAVFAVEKGVDYYHLDLAYLCRPESGGSIDDNPELPIISGTDEVHDARWVRLDQLGTLPLAKNVVEIVDLVVCRLQPSGGVQAE